MPERTVLQAITQRHLVNLGPSATVFQAACVMTRENCGSVLVMDGIELAGIVTERDLMTRVLAKGLDAASTELAQIMTRNPVCIPPETRVSAAVVIMIERGFRHLPIINSAKKVVGVFSVRDALPREVDLAASVAEFNEQVNDALG